MQIAVVGLSALSGPALASSIQEVQTQVSLERQRDPKLIGEATVKTNYIGLVRSNINEPVSQGISFSGTYQWYLGPDDWIVVKKIRETKPTVEPGTRILINRLHEDSVLQYEMFQPDSGNVNFLTGHLDEKWNIAYASGEIGRVWLRGYISKGLGEIGSPIVTDRGDSFEVTGTYRGEQLRLSIDKAKGMLVTEVEITSKRARAGYRIEEFEHVQGCWIAKRAKTWSGLYTGDQITEGTTSEIGIYRVVPFMGTGWPSELPKLPPSSIIGSDQSKLYKVADDGQLIYWGEQGHKVAGHFSLSLGNIFVLSGAGLLLACLWKIFFGNLKHRS